MASFLTGGSCESCKHKWRENVRIDCQCDGFLALKRDEQSIHNENRRPTHPL